MLDAQTGRLLGIEDRITRGKLTRKEKFTADALEHWPAVGAYPFYVFARGVEGDKLVEQITSKVLQPPIQLRRGERVPEGSTAPSIEKLVEWISPRLREDLVDKNSAVMQEDQRISYNANLFRDDYFVRYFGKPYDQLDATDFKAIIGQFMAKRPPVGSRQSLCRRFVTNTAPSGHCSKAQTPRSSSVSTGTGRFHIG